MAYPAAPPVRGVLRADAARNRARILDAAREVFAQRGVDVPMAAVARRAGVGIATLFRRFPTKQALVDEVFAEQLATCDDLLATALADPDPWRAFRQLLESVRAVQLRDRGFTQAVLATRPGAHDERRARAERAFAEVVRRAQAVGRLRRDFSPHDLALVLLATTGTTATPPEVADAVSRRLLAYLLQAFAAQAPGEGARPLPPPPALGLQAVIDATTP